MQHTLVKNKYNFYSVEPLPSLEEIQAHYQNTYFQIQSGNYRKKYSILDLQFVNESKVAEHVLRKINKLHSQRL